MECVSGCACKPSVLDGTSASRVSVFKVHAFKVGWMSAQAAAAAFPSAPPRRLINAPPPAQPQVSQHARCRIRVTVRREPGAVPQEGHKVTLAAVMAVHAVNESE